jgi:hypothetical protein
MIDEATIWKDVWPVVERLIEATLAEDDQTLATLVVSGEQAAETLDLFGFVAFDLLLKTVLGRQRLGLTRAIETGEGRSVYIEYAWPDPETTDRSYTAVDVVSVRLVQTENGWLVAEINPAGVDLPLTGARARTVLATTQMLNGQDRLPSEPWILPFTFYGGLLRLPFQSGVMADDVEALLLPGLQERSFGFMSLVRGRRLWRDFKAAAEPDLAQPAAWAAAAEFVLSEQEQRNVTQAATGRQYKTSLGAVAGRVKQIKNALQIKGLDERYSESGEWRVESEE